MTQKMQRFNEQKDANISEFLFGYEYIERRQVLKKLSKILEGLEWSLSCSSNLYFKGVVDDFNDFDIVVSKNSLDEAIERLRNAGAIEYSNSNQYNGCFASEYFEHWQLNGVDFDLMMNFTILVPGSKYVYRYTEKVQDTLELTGFKKIHLVPIEYQYIFYRMMEVYAPKRRMKRELIEEFMKSGGSTRINFLEVELEKMENDFGIPAVVKQDIADVITAVNNK